MYSGILIIEVSIIGNVLKVVIQQIFIQVIIIRLVNGHKI
jgi:hypothetical protein